MNRQSLRFITLRLRHCRTRRFSPNFWSGRGVSLCVSFMLLAVVPTVVQAQEQLSPSEWKRGYHGFSALCRTYGLEPTSNVAAWRQISPEQSCLVIFGNMQNVRVDLESYLQRGGAVLIATDRGSPRGEFFAGLTLAEGFLEAQQDADSLHGYRDCPIVTNIEGEHPITDGLQAIGTNRPGALITSRSFAGAQWKFVATFPPVRVPLARNFRPVYRNARLLAVLETTSGGKAVAVADQTIFSNQMLPYKDNALLAVNILRWFGETNRTSLLLIENHQVVAPPTPEQVDVEIPPPTADEVRRALRNLPPEALLEFGNRVAANVEDEGVPNELIAFLQQRIRRRDHLRFLVIALTTVLAFLAARRVFSSATSDDFHAEGNPDGRNLRGLLEGVLGRSGSDRRRAQMERQRVVRELLNQFRAEVASTTEISWINFARRLRIVGEPRQTRRMRREIRKASQRLSPDISRYWTRRRFERLETQVRRWRRLYESGAVQFVSH